MAQLTPHKDLLHRSHSVGLRAVEGRHESNWHMDINIAVIKIICDCSTFPDIKQNIVNDDVQTRSTNNVFNFIGDLYKMEITCFFSVCNVSYFDRIIHNTR